MRGPGIVGMVQLAAVSVFVIPMVVFGGQLLAEGRTLLGVGLIAVGLGMLAAERYLTNPLDPLDLLEGAWGWVRHRAGK